MKDIVAPLGRALSKFKCSSWSFVVEVPGGDDAIDKWRKNRLFNLPPQHGTPAPLVAKEHPRRMSWRKFLHLEIDHLGYSQIKFQVQLLVIPSWRFPSSATTSGAKVPSSLSVVTRARSYRLALGPPAAAPSGPPRTSAAAAPVTQNTPSGHPNRHYDSLIETNSPGPRPVSQSRRT